MPFQKTLAPVEDQGRPPIGFLNDLLNWAKTAPDEIFAPKKDVPGQFDVYNKLLPLLGEKDEKTGKYFWRDLKHRKAAMLELMRVHAGFESGWKWRMGVDTANPASMRNRNGRETGIFQVSFDSTWLDKDHGMDAFCTAHGINTVEPFIDRMKDDHNLAMEYYARLMRYSYKWAGPVVRSRGDSVDGYLRRDAVKEWEELL